MTQTLLSTNEAARDLDLSDGGVRRLARLGRLRIAFVTRGGRTLFWPRDVETLRRKREARKAA